MTATDPIVQAVARAIAKASWSKHRLPADSACKHCMEAWELAEVAVATARPLIAAEVATERDDLSQRLSALLCDLTNGRMSKTNYDVQTMVQEVEAAFGPPTCGGHIYRPHTDACYDLEAGR